MECRTSSLREPLGGVGACGLNRYCWNRVVIGSVGSGGNEISVDIMDVVGPTRMFERDVDVVAVVS